VQQHLGIRRLADLTLRLVLDVLVRGAGDVAMRAALDVAAGIRGDRRAYGFALGVLNVDGPGLLGVQIDVLVALLVLEAELVEAAAALGRVALEPGLGGPG
jgi:hypothetical protein